MEERNIQNSAAKGQIRICSLFSGIGGIDLGFIQAGFQIVWANEFDKDAARTYKHNFGSEYICEKDIRNVQVEDIPDFDVLVAGFPCQPFSVLGKQRGFDDPRGQLFFEIARIVKQKRPQVVFLENVANLLEHDDGKTFLAVYNALVPYGYTLKYHVIDAIDYGNVPQHRTRIFIVAFLDNDKCERFSFPDEIRRTAKLNDVLYKNEKHNDSYYFTEKDSQFALICQYVKDHSALYQYRETNKCYTIKRRSETRPSLLRFLFTFVLYRDILEPSFLNKAKKKTALSFENAVLKLVFFNVVYYICSWVVLADDVHNIDTNRNFTD